MHNTSLVFKRLLTLYRKIPLSSARITYKVRLTSVNEYTTKSQQGKKKDLISVYRDRPDEYSALSVTEFFEKQYKKNMKAYDNGKYTVLLPSGLNCKPVYPVDYVYARGMVIYCIIRGPAPSLSTNYSRTAPKQSTLF